MADLVVKDLDQLVDDLTSLIHEFEGALDRQNAMKVGGDNHKGLWGQVNANLSMNDFADNWTVHRDRMVKAMKTLRDNVKAANDQWTQADQKLADSLKT